MEPGRHHVRQQSIAPRSGALRKKNGLPANGAESPVSQRSPWGEGGAERRVRGCGVSIETPYSLFPWNISAKQPPHPAAFGVRPLPPGERAGPCGGERLHLHEHHLPSPLEG